MTHVKHNSGNQEWYTPSIYVEAAREAMGSISLDPASSDKANETVKARRYYTESENGLIQPWYGNVWLNPPYSRGLMPLFAEKVIEEIPNFSQCIMVCNNATETKWFNILLKNCRAVCFKTGRIRFNDEYGNPSKSPLQGQVFLYFGKYPYIFNHEFSRFGKVFIC